MSEETTDANTDTEVEEIQESIEGAESSTDTEQMEPVTDEDGFISTTEFKPVEVEPEVKVKPEADTSEETEQKTKSESSKQKPYHEDPAWQRIIKERDEAKAELEASKSQKDTFKPENFENQIDTNDSKRDAILDEFMNLDDEELSEMMINEPKKFRALTAQQLDREQTLRAKANQQIYTQKAREEKTQNELKAFFEKHEDGIELLKENKIQQLMMSNPAHNAISAYYELTSQANTEKQVQEAVNKAIKETEEKIYKQLKAKGNAGSFATFSGGRTINDDLSVQKKNPEKFGGKRAVAIALAKKRLAG